jgi:dTDP-glucose 4,6-dehydratase
LFKIKKQLGGAMRNILITGGAGFIGSNFIRYILSTEADIHVVNLDALTYAGSLNNLIDLPRPERYRFVQGEITDRKLIDQLFIENQIDTVVHFAAETHVDRSILGPGQFIQTNVVGTFTLLEAARAAWLGNGNDLTGKRFHHVSTDEVFGTLSPEEPAFTEKTPYAPNSPYSASKAGSDHLVRAYYHTYGLPVTITNCSNNYGPYQFPEKLIPLVILNALNGRPLPVYGDGMQIRDWLYVEDHCEAIDRVIRAGKVGETYNIGGNNQPPNIEIIERICDILDRALPESPSVPHRQLITYVKDRPGHDRRYAMNGTKIQTELGWQPRYTIETGLEMTVRWYLSHPEWIDAIVREKDYQGWMKANYEKRGEN